MQQTPKKSFSSRQNYYTQLSNVKIHIEEAKRQKASQSSKSLHFVPPYKLDVLIATLEKRKQIIEQQIAAAEQLTFQFGG